MRLVFIVVIVHLQFGEGGVDIALTLKKIANLGVSLEHLWILKPLKYLELKISLMLTSRRCLMSALPQLGSEVIIEGQMARIVRLVRSDRGLFQSQKGTLFIQDESYAQILFEDGRVDFLHFGSQREEYSGPSSKIAGLEPFVKE
jgi:hypothetical protein